MRVDPRTLAGLLIFVAAAEFFSGMLVAESVYPGYSISENYISDLGATCRSTGCVVHEPSATIFNASAVVLGTLSVVGAYLIRRATHATVFPVLLLATGAAGAAIGLLPETTGAAHTIASFVAFVFAGVSALWSYRLIESPFRYVAFALAAISLVSLGLFAGGVTLGLGLGGMERMIVYPDLFWGLGFGAYLMGRAPKGA